MQNKFINMLDSRFSKEAYLAILSDGSDENDIRASVLKRIALSEKIIALMIVISPEEFMSGIEAVFSIKTLPCLVVRDKDRDIVELWSYETALQCFCFNKKHEIMIQGVDIAPILRREFEQKKAEEELERINKEKELEAQIIKEEDYHNLAEVLKGWCGFRDAVKAFAQSPDSYEDALKIDLIRRTEQIGQYFQQFFKERLAEIEQPLKKTITKANELSQKQIQ